MSVPANAKAVAVPSIRKLDPTVINRIAAGEVVQRPSAAIKELIENSLDAGATSISITVKNGGLSLLQICDNGHGIRKEDLPIVCERFTTSKLARFDELQQIGTFGFRGEALASISHVAHVTLLTRTACSPCAYKAKYLDGQLVPLSAGLRSEARPCAGVVGTTLQVEDLFHNLPTRKQALRNTAEEFNRILDVVGRYSILYGERVSFTCRRQGASLPDLHTKGDRGENIRAILGAEAARELLPFSLDIQEGEVQCAVEGSVTSPNYSSKKSIFHVFINRRLVDCPPLKKGVEGVYAELLPRNAHPYVFLSLTLPGERVDVNRHPTKREVAFLFEQEVCEKICERLRQVLERGNRSRAFQVQTLLTEGAWAGGLEGQGGLGGSGKEEGEEGGEGAREGKKEEVGEEEEERDGEKRRKRGRGKEADGGGGEDGREGERAREKGAEERGEEEGEEEEEAEWQGESLVGERRSLPSSLAPIRPLSLPSFRFLSEEGGETRARPSLPSLKRAGGAGGGGGVGIGAQRPEKRVRVDSREQSLERFYRPLLGAGAGAGAKRETERGEREEIVESRGKERGEGGGSLSLHSSAPLAFDPSLCGECQGGCPCCSHPLSSLPSLLPSSALPPSLPPMHLPDLPPSPCALLSVQTLRTRWEREADSSERERLRASLLLGHVDASLSLYQEGTRLLLSPNHSLLHPLFYQLLLFQFASLPTFSLSPPIDIEEAVQSARRVWREGAPSAPHAAPPLPPSSSSSSPFSSLSSAVQRLVGHADMLGDYFGVHIVTERGRAYLCELPLPLPHYTPCLSYLPLFLLCLAEGVRYEEEGECLSSLLSLLASFYSWLEVEGEREGGEERQGTGREGERERLSLSERAREQFRYLLLPAVKKYLLVQRRDRGSGGGMWELTSLEKLYRVFERC